ncbi:MAG TPA: PilZ domain-containing protein [Vicinamibacteria bacterium]|nr:PilZ domain-containing protein [Vicinamibacteria bacterium]
MAHPTRRRRHKRVDTVGWCFAQLGDGWEGSVQNLSVGGMLLRLRRHLTPGSSYLMKLILEDQVAVVEGRVVRVAEHGEDCLAGVQFLTMAPEDASVLSDYVHR